MSKILAIDIETTGLNKAKYHIVEIGIAELDLKTGEREIIYDKRVWEKGVTIAEICASWFYENSDFIPEDMCRARSLNVDEIQEIINAHPNGAAAFNCTFDFGWLESRGLSFPRKLPDPMRIARDIVGALDKNGRIKNPNVEEAHEYFFPGSGYIEKHRAADDALHEVEIIFKLFKLGKYGSI